MVFHTFGILCMGHPRMRILLRMRPVIIFKFGARFDPWVRKILWRRKWQPTPRRKIPWTEEPVGLQSVGLQEESDTS